MWSDLGNVAADTAVVTGGHHADAPDAVSTNADATTSEYPPGWNSPVSTRGVGPRGGGPVRTGGQLWGSTPRTKAAWPTCWRSSSITLSSLTASVTGGSHDSSTTLVRSWPVKPFR
ncbi:hypothetical protein EDD40_1022 [Saccharothrix texasensis]|uniref:Uncharacterized protein n=1 Tax=Saccharothrix texasensis TaxID=103734 RepID=A0A3N1GZN9_9PSEU|nr:hypothetical protein EDD40_1022 [Saccharothrix texasensis]